MLKQDELWNKKMPQLLEELNNQPFLDRDSLVGIPEKGVYVFCENDEALYIGRSNRLRKRIREHGQRSSDRYSATFAFIMAKELWEQQTQLIANDIRREELERRDDFRPLFERAKERVSQMKVRLIRIDDQVEQALFEIYAYLALDTKYNDFGTH